MKKSKSARVASTCLSLSAWILAGIPVCGMAADFSVQSYDLSCPFPLVGAQQVSMQLYGDFPDQFTRYETSPETELMLDYSLATSVVLSSGLTSDQSVQLAGSATARFGFSGPIPSVGQTVSFEFPGIEFGLVDTGDIVAGDSMASFPSLHFEQVGYGEIVLESVTLTFNGTLDNGEPAPGPYGSFTSDCSIESDRLPLHTFEVVKPGSDLGFYNLYAGTGTADFTWAAGSFNLILESLIVGSSGVEPSIGTFIDILPTSGTFNLLFGMLPTRISAIFSQVASGYTEYKEGRLEIDTRFDIYLPEISASLFGMAFSLGGGESCKVTEYIEPKLSTPDNEQFSLTSGGKLVGDFELSGVSECGTLTPFLSRIFSGGKNVMEIVLKDAEQTMIQ